ncbi:MAG: amino acid adenylation domain-containing protein [Chitinophagaceae bacterium]|nr:amino acid adenylation domain-containing protein [Chitinophagaceae bacterium]
MHTVTIPLHPAQHDVYTDQLVKGNSPLYNVGGYICLKGKLNKTLFKKVVTDGPRYFDAFHMRFNLQAADFQTYIDKDTVHLKVDELDFTSQPNPAAAALVYMQERFNQPFNFEIEAPLTDQALLKISENEHWFYGKYHHLITDGYGFIVWIKYLADTYNAMSSGRELTIDYPPYQPQIEQAANFYQSEAYKKQGEYWKQKLAKKQAQLFRKKYTPPSATQNKSTSFVVETSEEQMALLEQVKQQTNAGILQLTLAAIAVYFGKATGESEFVVGVPIHKRGSRHLRNIVGMFSGILPFKNIYQPAFSVQQALNDISRSLKDDLKNQQYILGDIAKDLSLLPGDKLFDVVVNYEPFNFQVDFGTHLQASVFQLASNQADHALQFTWQDHGKQQPLILQVDYQQQYFIETDIRFMVDSLFKIFWQFSNNTTARLSGINILGDEELKTLSSFANASQAPLAEANMTSLFDHQALQTPGAIALIHDDSSITYQKLHERSNQVANYLLSLKLAPETLIPVCIERGIEMVIGILGILKAGAAYVPIDPAYPADRIQYMLTDTSATFVFSNVSGKKYLPSTGNFQIIELDDPTLFESFPSTVAAIQIHPNQLAYVIYTSGSTGKPKGVLIEHRNASAFLNWCQQEFSPDAFEMVYACTSICFDLSIFELFYPLRIGKPIRIVENGLHIAKYLPFDKKVFLNTVPTVIENLLNEKVSLQNVTVINMAGEPVPQQVLQGLDTHNIEVRNLYGPTEDTTYSTVFRLHKNQPVLIGKPITNSSIYLLNRQNGLVPLGMPGEICIGGAGLARGYLNRPELTAEKFISSPFSEGEKLYKTGDLGCRTSDGNIQYLGRMDNQVKLRGYRIELGEIENVIQQSGMVQNAVVVVYQDRENNKMLIAYATADQSIDIDSLNNYLRSKLPDYMIPARWMQLDKIPLTPNGKVDRKNLPEPGAILAADKPFEAPANEMEQVLCNIWKEVLAIDTISVNDNFFELGGHSIKAIQVLSRLHKSLEIKIDFSLFALHPTIRQFANAIQSQVKSTYTSIQKVPDSDLYELSHAQKRMYVLCQLQGGSVSFNSPAAFEISGTLDAGVLNQVLQFLIDRHESLRTVFIEKDGEPKQKILKPEEVPFHLQTLDVSNDHHAADTLQSFINKEATTEFDLAKGPLFKAILIAQSQQRHTLFFNMHHIISDGWSKGILINDFIQTLSGLHRQQAPALPPLLVTYKDYAAWQKTIIESQHKFWEQALIHQAPVLNFPADFERPAVVTFSGQLLQTVLPAETTSQLQAFCVAHNITLNNLLFALYGLMVAHYSKQQQVVIGTLTSGRSHADLEQVVGLFINFLPITLQIDGEASVSKYLQSCQQTLALAYSHQDYPFDLMVEHFVATRDFSRNPLFDTMVNFHSENELATEYKIDQEISSRQLTISPLPQFKENLFQSNLDFKLDIEPLEHSLLFNLTYNTGLFTKKRMENFLSEFKMLVEKIATKPLSITADYMTMPVEPGIATQNTTPETEFPVCISGTFVCEPLLEYISYWGDEYDLNLDVKFADYNQVFQQLLNPASIINTNKGINVIFIRMYDWLREKSNLSEKGTVDYLNRTYEELLQALEFSATRNYVPMLVGIVSLQYHAGLSQEINDHISQLNQKLKDWLQQQNPFVLLDLNKAATLYEVETILDEAADEMGHIPFTQEYFAALGTYIARKIRSYRSKVYKVIALDCDNTLWKGIVGELGCMQVSVNEHFEYVQHFLIEKYQEGFLLVLCSKNNEPDVWEVFDKNPAMKLKRKHIAAHRINWSDKPQNIAAIANELNVGLNSFIFIDDSQFEVEQMSMACPEVLSLFLPEDENELKSFVDHTWEFDVFKTTREDVQRNQMYQTEKSRKDEETKHGSLKDFMKSLDIQVNVRNVEQTDLDRSVQLSLRTNQFNMNGIRRTAEEITSRLKQPSHLNWIVEVSDRFGDYGMVGLLLGSQKEQVLQLDTFLLSCRVLGRGVEELVLEQLKTYCLANNCREIMAHYQVTAKNRPFEVFLNKAGWQQDSKGENCHLKIKYSKEEISL